MVKERIDFKKKTYLINYIFEKKKDATRTKKLSNP